MLKFFFVTILGLFSVLSHAQFTIKGSIVDSQTKAGLPGASIKISGIGQAAISDDRGFFEIQIQKGEHEIAASYVGYNTEVITMKVDSDESLQIMLDPKVNITDAVVVNATRATDKTPTTFTTIEKESIQRQNFGQDLPYLINWTPSVVTTSDAGTGIGYTGLRIRGSDGTRINVTINGIPYNDAESMGTFWIDIPDIASSSQSIQIQRGVGTSTNGAGAFGATINLQTNTRQEKPYAEAINSFGSFNTRRHTLTFGSGLLNDHWIIEGRVSKISSDGFIDRASADLRSYYFSAGFYNKNTVLKAVMFGGKERTYQSWYGVPQSRLENDNEAMDITAMNEGWNNEQIANLKNSNSRTFNPYLYPDQVDDYQQDNYQLHFSQRFSEAVSLNTSLHYTPGKGYYEEYRYNDDFANYRLNPVTIGDSVVESSDIIRRRWLDNDFYGFTYSLNYDKNNWNVILGGGWNRYEGDHFGEIIWAQVAPAPTGYRYYFNKGDKKDFNTYFKANYQLSNKVNAFIDLQYRGVNFHAAGDENKGNVVDVGATYGFFNPKLGLTWSLDANQQFYGSLSIANREPVRDDFVDNPGKTPKYEQLRNVEIGYRRASEQHVLHVNYYLMDYRDQLVLTGKLNDVGASVRTNVAKSYRTGIEIESVLKISKVLNWNANLTLSKNKIRSFDEILYDYGVDFDQYTEVKRTYQDTDISFSPNIIAGSQLSYFPAEGLEVCLLSKYVGKQYLDNTSNDERSIEGYLVNDVRLGYTWKPSFIREIGFSFLINNVLSEEYESNGYTWGYLGGGLEYRENYYYPQAGRNFMGMITVKF